MDQAATQPPAGSSTLKQLCPEDKEKVAKLLRQVVQLGQENSALRAKTEKAVKDDKEGKDKINQWQDCNKQVILNNIRLKGKLSQLVTLLRMYHHKVQVLDAALRATQNQQGSPGAVAAAAEAEAALQACLGGSQQQLDGECQQLPTLDAGMAVAADGIVPSATSISSMARPGAPDGGASAGPSSSSSSLSVLALSSPAAAAAAAGSPSNVLGDNQAAGVVLLAPQRSQQPSPAMVCAPGQLLQFDPSVGQHGAFVLLEAVDLLSEEDQQAQQLRHAAVPGLQQQGPPLALPSAAASPQPSQLDVLEQVEAWSPPRRGNNPVAAIAGAGAAATAGYNAALLGPGSHSTSTTHASAAVGAGARDGLASSSNWPSSLQQVPYGMGETTSRAAAGGGAAGAAAPIPTAWRQGAPHVAAAAAGGGVDASSPTRGKLLNLARAFDSLAGRSAGEGSASPVRQQSPQAAAAAVAGGEAWLQPGRMAPTQDGLMASRSTAAAGAPLGQRTPHPGSSLGASQQPPQQQRHHPVIPEQATGFVFPWPRSASAPGVVEEVVVEAESSVPVAITKEPSWWHRSQAAAAAAGAPEPAYSSSSNPGPAWGRPAHPQEWQQQPQFVHGGAGAASTSSSRRHTALGQPPAAAAAAAVQDNPYQPYQQQQYGEERLPWQQHYDQTYLPPPREEAGWGLSRATGPLYSPTSSPEANRPSATQPEWGMLGGSLLGAGAGAGADTGAVPLDERTVLGRHRGHAAGGRPPQQQAPSRQQPQAPTRQQQVYSSASSSMPPDFSHGVPGGLDRPEVVQLRGSAGGGSGNGGTTYWSPPGSKWPVQSLPPPAAPAAAGVSRRGRAASAAGGARSSSKGMAPRPTWHAATAQQQSRAPLSEMQQQQGGVPPQQQHGAQFYQHQHQPQDWEVEPEVLEVCRSLSRSSMVSTRSQPSQPQPQQQLRTGLQTQQQRVMGAVQRTPRTSTVAGMPMYGSGRPPSLAAAAAAAQGQPRHHRMSVASSCWDDEALPVGVHQAGPAAELGPPEQLLEDEAAGDGDSSSVLARYDESLMEVLLQVERLEQQHGRYQQELQHALPAHHMRG